MIRLGVEGLPLRSCGARDVPISAGCRRLTLDLHTREVLGETIINSKLRGMLKEGKNPLSGPIPGGPKDILTYFFTKQKSVSKQDGPATSRTKGSSGSAQARRLSPRSPTSKGDNQEAVPSRKELDGGQGDPSAPETIETPKASKRSKGASSSGGENRGSNPPENLVDVCGICEPDSNEETRDDRGVGEGGFE